MVGVVSVVSVVSVVAVIIKIGYFIDSNDTFESRQNNSSCIIVLGRYDEASITSD